MPPAASFLGKKLGKNLQPNKVENVAVQNYKTVKILA